jgi:hypothetical protein
VAMSPKSSDSMTFRDDDTPIFPTPDTPIAGSSRN